jgi:allantoin racemase
MRTEKKIKLVVPITSKEFQEEHKNAMKALGRGIEVIGVKRGSPSIESFYDTAFSVPATVLKVEEAEKEGFKAVVLDCFDDPGLHAAREKVDILVVGPGQASMLMAMALGDKFSIITITDTMISSFQHNAYTLGIERKLASVRAIGIPVLELSKRVNEVKERLFEESVKAIKEDGASVIILGCTGMLGIAKELYDRLKKEGYDVPVIDPLIAAISLAEALINMGVKHSRITYRKPPEKERSY